MERDNVNETGDNMFNVVCGDLGLGQSTRASIYLSLQEPLMWNESSLGEPLSPPPNEDRREASSHSGQSHGHFNFRDRALLFKRLQAKWLKGEGKVKEEDWEEVFPTYADVPYGSSMRQQKKLYERQREGLRRQHLSSTSGDQVDNTETVAKPTNNSQKNLSVEEIDSKLCSAIGEMEELKIELDACRRRLDAKYKAVAILKEQAELADTELKSSELKASENNKKLEQELSKLQFELEWKESSFMDSQQTWAQRFDRVCQENSTLMSKLEARNEELRCVNAHKAAIIRERDELLALLDVTERLKYEQGKSRIAEENYGTFSSSELAVLGACKCRISNPEPCGCAHAAANLRKEVARLREETEISQHRREEANLTADAYRTAFEEQLVKTRNLSLHISRLTTITSRSSKAKAAMKFLIQVLNEDDTAPVHPPVQLDTKELDPKNLPQMSLQELVTVLTDLVNEKKEALAHQKLTIKLMAGKIKILESKQEHLSVVDVLSQETNHCTDSGPSTSHQINHSQAMDTIPLDDPEDPPKGQEGAAAQEQSFERQTSVKSECGFVQKEKECDCAKELEKIMPFLLPQGLDHSPEPSDHSDHSDDFDSANDNGDDVIEGSSTATPPRQSCSEDGLDGASSQPASASNINSDNTNASTDHSPNGKCLDLEAR